MKGDEDVTISERVNQIIMASIHYRNRQLVFRWVMSEHNRHKYISAAQDLEQKKAPY